MISQSFRCFGVSGDFGLGRAISVEDATGCGMTVCCQSGEDGLGFDTKVFMKAAQDPLVMVGISAAQPCNQQWPKYRIIQ